MNKGLIIKLCRDIKKRIDLEFDECSECQETMEDIKTIANSIINEVRKDGETGFEK